MFVSESEYSIDWYAKNVGLVKSETVTKKGKVLLSTLLYAIKQQSAYHATNKYHNISLQK